MIKVLLHIQDMISKKKRLLGQTFNDINHMEEFIKRSTGKKTKLRMFACLLGGGSDGGKVCKMSSRRKDPK